MTTPQNDPPSKTIGTQVSVDAPIVVIGLGYVGLPLALAASAAGYDIVGFDTSTDRTRSIESGRSYIEDIDDETLGSARRSGRLRATSDESDLPRASIVVITVPTPLTAGTPDLSAVEAASRLAGRLVDSGSLVILESTSYPGTTQDLVVPILEEASGLEVGDGLLVGYSPERIDPGNARWTLSTTPKLVSGVDGASLVAVEQFYARFVQTTVRMVGTREAEMAKLLENTFRHVNIALVNELAISTRAMGIDVVDVLRGAATKPFGFMSFTPGPGVGGHCLPVDPVYLSWQFEQKLGTPTRFVEVANDINRGMADHVVRRVQAGLNDRRLAMNGSRVLVVGVAYKKNTRDVRETPATPIVRQMRELGADITVYDPLVANYELDGMVARLDVLDDSTVGGFDAIVILADHDIIDFEVIERANAYVFDTRYRLRGPGVETL